MTLPSFMKKLTPLLAALLLCGCMDRTITVEISPSSEGQINFVKDTPPKETTIQEIEIPSSFYIDVPFTPQAPHANWNDPYQEACEEASVIMVDYFFRNLEFTPEQANREIVQLVNWEQSNGYGQDVNVEQMRDIVEDYYGYTARVSDNVSAESIMYEVSKGNPVILPAAGRLLKNPYFSGEGPFYHMLVVIGYDKKHFITNDPGTKRGADYKYDQETLLNAVHDWTGIKEETHTGAKRMLIIER